MHERVDQRVFDLNAVLQERAMRGLPSVLAPRYIRIRDEKNNPPMISQIVGSRRLHHLDGLRGFAALVVVFSHFVVAFDFALYNGNPRYSRGEWDLWMASAPFDVALPGNLAVCLFFVLSGYVLAGSFNRTSLGIAALTARRYIRLGLPIFVVTLIAWALHAKGAMDHPAVALLTHSAWLEGQMPGPNTVWLGVKQGAYGSLLFGRTLFDSSLWTMSIEFAGSAFLILIFVGSRIFGLPGTRLRCQVIMLLLFSAATHNSYLCLFGIGALISLSDLRHRTERLCGNTLVVTGLICVGLLLGTVSYSIGRPPFVTWLLSYTPINRFTLPLPYSFGVMGAESSWHAAGSVLLLIAIDGSPRLRELFSRRGFQFLGRISFPLYLIHVPVLLSFGCGLYLVLLRLDWPVPVATSFTFFAYGCLAIAAAWALTPVENIAIRFASATAEAVQAQIEFGLCASNGSRRKRVAATRTN